MQPLCPTVAASSTYGCSLHELWLQACDGGAGGVSRAERGALREKIGAMLLQYVRAELDTPATTASTASAAAATMSVAALVASPAPPAAAGGATSRLQRVGAVAIDVCASVGLLDLTLTLTQP